MTEAIRWVDEVREPTRVVAADADARLAEIATEVTIEGDGSISRVGFADGAVRFVGDRQPKPFNFQEYTRKFYEQFSEYDVINRKIREAMDQWHRDALAQWEQMLKDLPTPPEGTAWFPVTVTEDEFVDLDDNKATITYRIRPELRDV